MALTAVFGVFFEHYGDPNGIGNAFQEDQEDWAMGSMFYHLELIAGWWSKFQPLTTFVTTFFLAEAFSFWKRFYGCTRIIQGRFNDISLLAVSSAARGEDGEITEEAKEGLDDIARLIRLLHQLYWSAVVKRFNALQSPEGISYLLSFRLITTEEYESLTEVGARHLGGWQSTITWLTTRLFIAKKKGELEVPWVIFDNITILRGTMAEIPDMYDGRMPLAYVHFVSILVNTLIFVSPIALFPSYYYW
jgi:hypothetical protein